MIYLTEEMVQMRKAAFIMAVLLALLLLTGCQSRQETQEVTQEATETVPHQTVYASFYPIYAISEMILKDVPEMELRQLVQPQDGCLRDYQLSDWDLYQLLLNSNAVIIGGRGLESFESTIQNLGETGPAVVTLFQNLTLDNNGAQSEDENASHLDEENPHLYLSARALPQILESLYAYMLVLDPAYEDVYTGNLDAALASTEELIGEYDAAQAELNAETPVALLNEALIYPANDLGLNVVCRIDRESGTNLYGGEKETMLQNLHDAGAEIVLIEKQAPDSLVYALQDEGYRVVKLDILSTGRPEAGSEGYFKVMRENLRAIQENLSK